MAEHRVGFGEFRGALADGVQVGAEGVGDLLHFVVGVREEFVQRRVKQAGGHRPTRHDDEKPAEVFAEAGTRIEYSVGTMIELPRAALQADKIAEDADFFSFGTNDLTQTVFGLSRDDAGKFLPYYVDNGVLPKDPFVSIDVEGVGEMVRIACEKGRATKNHLKMGICGEHGGDPASISFCEHVGLDYVSCSPFRVPVARLAAAQAALGVASDRTA